MEDRIEAYVQALCAEIALLAAHLPPAHQNGGASVAESRLRPSIFFGGGTPSMLTPTQFARVLQAADTVVPLAGAEISIEANPGSVMGTGSDAHIYLRELRAVGINRLSLGVQSLHDPTLRILGRPHTAAEAYTCFATARRAGFDNINLDFMFGLPGQTSEQWQHTLDTIATWGTDHFSFYSLILEETTPLYAQVTGGHVSLPDDEITAVMYERAMEQLAAAGYVQYEISNWARAASPGPFPLYAAHHNLAYWLNSDYLAAGAGAHGHVYPQRYMDVLNIDAYIAAVARGERPLASTTPLTATDLEAETMFMGLRLTAGVSPAHFYNRCGRELHAAFGTTLDELQAAGLITTDAAAVRLTPKGRLLGNHVFTAFV
jgi:oxygen-independent coproporphyrinogen-3 oxidase